MSAVDAAVRRRRGWGVVCDWEGAARGTGTLLSRDVFKTGMCMLRFSVLDFCRALCGIPTSTVISCFTFTVSELASVPM